MRFIVIGDSKGKNHGINEKILSMAYRDFIPDSTLENYNKTVCYKDFGDTMTTEVSSPIQKE